MEALALQSDEPEPVVDVTLPSAEFFAGEPEERIRDFIEEVLPPDYNPDHVVNPPKSASSRKRAAEGVSISTLNCFIIIAYSDSTDRMTLRVPPAKSVPKYSLHTLISIGSFRPRTDQFVSRSISLSCV